jgi:uncharacterized protein YndB with AHSA1/START domain
VRANESDSGAKEAAAIVPPPIEIDALVACAPIAAFEYFTRDIGRWWPLARYSCSQERAAGVAFDERLGGMLTETDLDGKTYVWGTVLEWEPGRRVKFSWHPGKPPENALTVAITFEPAGASTRVRLLHSGWERLGATAVETHASYKSGWPTVLGQLYAGYCNEAAGQAR